MLTRSLNSKERPPCQYRLGGSCTDRVGSDGYLSSSHFSYEDPDKPQSSGDRRQRDVDNEVPETVALLIEVVVIIGGH